MFFCLTPKNSICSRDLQQIRLARGAFLTICCAMLAGCGGSGQLETALVQGTVKLDGKPLTQGMVIFSPLKGRGASGAIQSDGTFSLTTYQSGDGALVGIHKVAVMPDVSGGRHEGPEGSTGSRPSQIPQKYLAPDSSGLTFEVKAGQHNQAQLELSSK